MESKRNIGLSMSNFMRLVLTVMLISSIAKNGWVTGMVEFGQDFFLFFLVLGALFGLINTGRILRRLGSLSRDILKTVRKRLGSSKDSDTSAMFLDPRVLQELADRHHRTYAAHPMRRDVTFSVPTQQNGLLTKTEVKDLGGTCEVPIVLVDQLGGRYTVTKKLHLN